MCPVATTRWCPTPEQLMILEEMYKGGVRTPNATQIQQITSHLSLYGKIEGKNVFYWFQNHKARDRQKLRRRQLMTKQCFNMIQHQQQHQEVPYHHNMMEQKQFQYRHEQNQQQQQPSGTQFLHHFIEIDPPSSDHDTSTGCGFHGRHNSTIFHAQLQRSSCNRTSSCRAQQQQQPQYEMMMMMSRSCDVGDGDGDDDNWVMMAENVGPVIDNSNIGSCWRSSTSTRPPLKTLDLFPTTATGLKQLGNQDNDHETTRSRLLQAPEVFPNITAKSIDVTPPPAIIIIN